MPANKEAYIRYRIIDKMLATKTKRYPSKLELTEACRESLGYELSIKTIEKDLDTMRYDEQLGYMAPIEWDSYKKGYYYAEDGYSINKMHLNEDEKEGLLFAARLLESYKDAPLFENVSESLEKVLEKVEVGNKFYNDTDVLEHVHFDRVYYMAGGEHFDSILEAIRLKKQLSFEYQKFGDETHSARICEPKQLKEYKGIWYMLAHYPETNELRTFALDRIVSSEVLDKGQETDLFEETRTYYNDTVGVTRTSNKKEQIRITFTPQQGNYVRIQPIHQSQKVIADADGKFEVQLELIPNHEFYATLLSYGDTLLDISPEAVKGEYQRRAKHNVN